MGRLDQPNVDVSRREWCSVVDGKMMCCAHKGHEGEHVMVRIECMAQHGPFICVLSNGHAGDHNWLLPIWEEIAIHQEHLGLCRCGSPRFRQCYEENCECKQTVVMYRLGLEK